MDMGNNPFKGDNPFASNGEFAKNNSLQLARFFEARDYLEARLKVAIAAYQDGSLYTEARSIAAKAYAEYEACIGETGDSNFYWIRVVRMIVAKAEQEMSNLLKAKSYWQ